MNKVSYICDVCGREITNPDEGVMLWNWTYDRDNKVKHMKDFQIVHKAFTQYACDDRSRRCSTGIPITTIDAITFWLTRLDTKFAFGPELAEETKVEIDHTVVEAMMRTLLPGYEEARFHADAYSEEVLGERDGYGIEMTPEGMKDILKWAKKQKERE